MFFLSSDVEGTGFKELSNDAKVTFSAFLEGLRPKWSSSETKLIQNKEMRQDWENNNRNVHKLFLKDVHLFGLVNV